MTARTFGRMMLMEAGFGVAEGIIGETGYQLINGTKIKDLDVGHIAVSGVMGGASGIGGALAGEAIGAGLRALKNTRVVSKAINTMQDMASRGKNAIRRGVDKLADFGRHQLGLESVAYVTPEGLVVRGPRIPDNGMRLFEGSGSDGMPSGKAYKSGSNTVKSNSNNIVVTEEVIRNAMKDAPLKTQQKAVSIPVIQEYVNRVLAGEVDIPDIKVDGDIIVDGNHRYITSRITGTDVGIKAWSGGKPDNVIDWTDVILDSFDWGNR